MLTVWRLELSPLPLLQFLEAQPRSNERIRAAIDANVFFDLDELGPGHAASRGLEAPWLEELIDLCVTHELFNEIDRREEEVGRARQRERVHCFTQLHRHADRDALLFDAIRPLLPTNNLESTDSDARQLAMTIAAGVRYFITRDEAILGTANQLDDDYDLQVLSPYEVVCHFDAIRREDDYRPRRLFLGPGAHSRLARSEDLEQMVALFHDGQPAPEPRRRTEGRLRELLSAPTRYEAYNITLGGALLASFVLERPPSGELRIPFFAVAASALGPTAARHFGRHFVAIAARENRRVVVAARSGPRVNAAFGELGFLNHCDHWVKLALPLVASFPAAAADLRTLGGVSEADAVGCQWADALVAISAAGHGPEQILAAERALWPLKLVGTRLPSYIVPIRPGWAHQLFDHDLAERTLFGATPELALSSESVYYRAARPRLPTAPARLLWYVSADPAFPGSMAVRACSQIDEISVGPARDVFRRNRRLGIYEWHDALETANGDAHANIMAVRFGRTELFSYPVGFERFQEILQDRNGIGNQCTGPLAISDECFFDIYCAGTGRSIRS